MILPELNHISPYLYTLSGFGGINRRETADIGELADAVNLSSDEYPLIMPRKRYDVGLFPKTALMWHNNDRDMALVPALKSDDVEVFNSIQNVISFALTSANGRYGIVYTSEYTGMLSYVTGDTVDGEDPPLFTYELKPGKAYWINKAGWNTNRNCMKGSIELISDKSYIYYFGKKIALPDVVAFKNPVCSNIGTSTVICDEINGMWVLEYDKDTDTYSYNKVHSKYTVKNEYNKSSGVDYISGGNFCHMRIMFENGVPPANFAYSFTNDTFKTHEDWVTEYVSQENSYNQLVYCGTSTDGFWVQVLKDGAYKIVDNLIYRFCIPNADKYFKVGDYIKLSGIASYNVNPKSENAISDNTVLKELEGYHEIINIEYTDDYGWGIDIKCEPLSKPFAMTMFVEKRQLCKQRENGSYESEKLTNDLYMSDGMTIERKAPENVRFICSHMNRIWANNGDNEIMCCARGNPYVWYRYEGNSLDSWATTIGGDGSFTGCINYGYPLFFKDNRMFRITGSRPANFGFDEYSIRGIKAGCHDSAVIVNDILYYQSIDGIYAYAQSIPVCISGKVYRGRWLKGKACRFRDKYYIAVQEENDGESRCLMYCYDTKTKLWHRENMNGAEVRYLYPGRYLNGYEEYMTVYTDYTEKEKKVSKLVSHTGSIIDLGSLPAFTEEEKAEQCYAGYVMSTDGTYEHTQEDPVEWSFETTDLLASEREHKYLKAIYVNCRIYNDDDNSIRVYAAYDDNVEWDEPSSLLLDIGHGKIGKRATWYKHELYPKHCENLRLKVEGRGKAVIYSIILEFEQGSEYR